MINNMPNATHPTLTLSIIFKGTKIDLNVEKVVPYGSYAALHCTKRVDNKYQSHTDNGNLLYQTDDTTSNMTAWISGRNTVAIINKYTIIKAHPDDVPYLRHSIRNLRFHQPINDKLLKITSGISVKHFLIINEKKEIRVIVDEVKNMLDYKVRHYIKYEDIPPTYKKNILRSFIFIQQKFFPNGDMDILKAR